MKLSKAQITDFIVLTLRWYLAYYMADYGIGKLTGEQFGIYDVSILDKPLREVDKFHLAWHLFSLDKTFNIGVGLMQIICALLLVFNRTVLIGALAVMPILLQIFLVDVAFTVDGHGYALPVRLFGMITCDVLILLYYKEKVLEAFRHLTRNVGTKKKYPWWVFIFMPLLGLITDPVLSIILYPVTWLLNHLVK